MEQRCKCGKHAHPQYGGSCEDCFSERQGHYSKGAYDNEKTNLGGLNTRLSALEEMDIRILGALEQGGVVTIGDVFGRTDAQLLGIRGIGDIYLAEARRITNAFSVALPPDV